jgi:thiol-disulfide isomerase/thioredoxin
MKKIIFFVIAVFVFSHSVLSQNYYETLPDKNGGTFFKGIIAKDILLNDSACSKWYAGNLKGFTPNAAAVEALKRNVNTIQLLVFMGTWCDDSHFIIPKFYTLLEAAGFPENRVTLIGTDRAKKTHSHLAEALGIVNVPTIMIMKDGKELGRVVEYGKYGMFDKEMGDIIMAAEAGKNQ